jgi:hypothetical protein
MCQTSKWQMTQAVSCSEKPGQEVQDENTTLSYSDTHGDDSEPMLG